MYKAPVSKMSQLWIQPLPSQSMKTSSLVRWFNVDCSTVEEFYSINDDNYAAALEAGK